MDLSALSDDDLQKIAGSQPAAASSSPFASMSDADLEHIAGSGSHQGPLSNAPGGDPTEKAMLKGAATAAIKGTVGGTLGMPGNLRDMADYLVQRAHSAISGTPMEELQQRRAALEEKKTKLEKDNPWMGIVQPPPPGEYFTAPILARTGEYHPTTPEGRLAMAGIEGTTSMLGPGAVANKGFGNLLKGLVGGGVSGVLGDAATMATGDPLWGLVGGAAPSVAAAVVPRALTNPMTNYLSPIGKRNTESLAAKKYAETASDPEKALADLKFQPREYIEGSSHTPGEIAGDTGLLGAQKRAMIENKPVTLGGETRPFREALVTRDIEQNTARRGEMGQAVPDNANPMDAVKFYLERQAQIEADTQAKLDRGRNIVEQVQQTMPSAQPAEVIGQRYRELLEKGEEATRKNHTELYNAMDPDGKLTSPTANSRQVAENLKGSFDPTVEMSAEYVMPVVEMMTKLTEEKPFRAMMKLDQTITDQMSAARRNGQYSQARTLGMLKDAVMADINSVAEGSTQLAAAKAAYGEYAKTYRQGPIASALEDTGFKGQYKAPDSSMLERFFPGGDKGYELTSTALKGANYEPAAISTVQDMAVHRLQKAMGNGDLTPKVLDAWKQKYGSSLRAIDEVSPGFSARFDNIAAATDQLAALERAKQATVEQAKTGAAGRLMKLSDPQEVTRVVGSLLTAPDGPTQIRKLVTDANSGAVTSGPRALDGLRAAGIKFMMDRFESAARQGDNASLQSGAFRKFVNTNEASLSALFGKDGMRNINRVVDDMERSAAAANAVVPKLGEASAQQTVPMIGEWMQKHPLMAKVGAGSSIGAYAALAFQATQTYGLPAAGVMLAGSGGAAFLHSLHAKGITRVDDLYRAALLDPKIGEALLARADKDGKLNMGAIDRLLTAIHKSNLRNSALLDTYRDDARVGRKEGGRIMDHGTRADALIRAAERAKRAHGGTTEKLLALPDEHIARSLAIANQAMRHS